MRSTFLPFSTPTIEEAEINEVVDSLRSGWITTGPKVKLEDGTEEEHKIIDSKDPKAIKNLIDWILSQ